MALISFNLLKILSYTHENRWTIVLAGSGKHVRSLCYGKLDQQFCHLYPAYRSDHDLNDTKVQMRVLTPIVDAMSSACLSHAWSGLDIKLQIRRPRAATCSDKHGRSSATVGWHIFALKVDVVPDSFIKG